MQYTTYGDTGLTISRLCIGCGHFEKAYPDPKAGGQFLLRALERGITFWDTAEVYRSHPHIAAAFRQTDRGQVVLQTKTGETTYDTTAEHIDTILQELETEYLDVILLHAINSPRDLAEREGALRAMLEAKAAGKVRHVGCSTHIYTGPVMDAVTQHPAIEVILCTANKGNRLLEGSIVDPAPGAPRVPAAPSMEAHCEQIRRAYEAGKGISLMKLLAGGDVAEPERPAWIEWGFEFPYAHAVNLGITFDPELDLDCSIESRAARARISRAA